MLEIETNSLYQNKSRLTVLFALKEKHLLSLVPAPRWAGSVAQTGLKMERITILTWRVLVESL